ncbi:hypothetical protein KPL71_008626 [Citrus sinensis]|uniref:Uncharacterized protein n=1 Tax=Citrus sinensis TaxID=2711 RepID=A0ACB8M7J6_CITSI|nr:hypothetical protein KPL71_008626 [Citrus sinensis]
MRKLRFLKFYSSSFNGENKCKSLPSSISAEKLVFLEMPNSSIEQLWDGMKHRGKLNQTIHAACKMLIAKTPNPTLIPHLNKLVILNLRGSKSLKSLPAGIFNLEFLTTLDLSGCSKLKRLPEISSSNTSCLFLSGTAIEELPSSIELLIRLGYLDLSDCKRLKSLPSSLCKLKSLEILDLSGCSSLQRLSECLGQLSSLGTLLLEKTNIERIPESIIQISVLTYLRLSYCERLQSVPKLPSLIRRFLKRLAYVESDHLLLGCYFFTEAVRFFFDDFDRFPPLECECCGVKKCGVHLLYIPDSTDSMEVPSRCFNCYEED